MVALVVEARITRKQVLKEKLKALQSFLAEVWSYGMGKAGLILIIFLVVVSVYAAVTMPPGIVETWTYNRKFWEANPDVVPPTWVSLFGQPIAPHMVYTFTEPTEAKTLRRPLFYEALNKHLLGYIETYRAEYSLESEALPKSLLIKFANTTPGNLTIRGRTIEPHITVYVVLHRPNGETILVNKPESKSLAEIDIIRVDHVSLGVYFAEKYGIDTKTAQSIAFELLFGEFAGEEVKPVTGRYEVEVIVQYLAPGVDPKLIERAVSNGKLGINELQIVVEGSAYGLVGTDHWGRDLYLGLLYGFPVALLVGFFAAVAFVVIGLVVGVVSGYYGGMVDEIIQRVVDVIGNIPLLPLLILVGIIVQEMDISPWERLFIIIGFLVAFSWGGLTIIVRSMTLSIKAEPYIESAKAIGASNARIIFRHIIPQIVPYAMASLVFNVPAAILTEAGLSILGIRHGLPTWGAMLADARGYIGSGGRYDIWWWILPPGILIGITSVAFVFLGLAMETIVEPRLRRR